MMQEKGKKMVNKDETLEAIGRTYNHWKHLIRTLQQPTITTCPLCRLTYELFGLFKDCRYCSVLRVMGDWCYDDEDYKVYNAEARKEEDRDIPEMLSAGEAILDKILTLWLDVFKEKE